MSPAGPASVAAPRASGAADHCFVVPAYGRSPYLEACLASLRAQTRPSPVVVVTSTPFEGIEALVDAYSARLVVHGPNRGIGHDWNRALAAATAPWVTLAHQDDVYLPDFGQKTMAAIEGVADAVLAFTGYAEQLGTQVRDATAMLRIKKLLLFHAFLGRPAVRTRASKLRTVWFGSAIPCPAVTLNLARAESLGRSFEFRTDLKVNMDWDAWVRLARTEGSFVRVPDALVLHRIHLASETSAAIADGVRLREDRMMFDALWPRWLAGMLARCYRLSYAQGVDA